MKKVLVIIFLCLFTMSLLTLIRSRIIIDIPGVHNDTPKQFNRTEQWEIKYRFTIAGDYKPVEKHGKLSDRFTGIKIYVYNQQTDEFEEIEHNVSYGIDARERKTMIVVAVVPEKIKNITVEKIKYYMESYADGYYNKNPVVEALIN